MSAALANLMNDTAKAAWFIASTDVIDGTLESVVDSFSTYFAGGEL